MKRPQAIPVLHVDDDRFRATEWRFEPGAETGWHVHSHDYVIVPLVDGRLGLEEPGGAARSADLKAHVPYARGAGVSHNVINAGDGPLAFLEVEVVDDGPIKDRLATLERFNAAWNARDVDALMACMADPCAFHAASGPGRHGALYDGRPAVRAAYAAIFDAWPEAEWRDARHMVSGETGVSSWLFVGRARNGQKVETEGCDLFEFRGERIALKNSFRKSRS